MRFVALHKDGLFFAQLILTTFLALQHANLLKALRMSLARTDLTVTADVITPRDDRCKSLVTHQKSVLG